MTLTNDAHPFASLNIILVMLFNTLSTLHTNRSLSARPHTCDPPPSRSLTLSSHSQRMSRDSQLRPDVNRLHGRRKKKKQQQLGYLRGLVQSHEAFLFPQPIRA